MKPFIFPLNAIEDLNTVREDYQAKKGVQLDAKQSFLKRGLHSFGVTDIVTRNKQTLFLKQMATIFQPYKDNLIASQIMTAVVIYVMSQIDTSKRRSALFSLLEDKLGMGPKNPMDEETKQACLAAAELFLFDQPRATLKQINAILQEKGIGEVNKSEWLKFKSFLTASLDPKIKENYAKKWPITALTKPLFTAIFATTGATLGYLGGDMISRSTQALSIQTKFAATIGSILVVFGAGPYGVALFAPIVAERLLNVFLSISLAQVLGVTMGLVGHGVGAIVGYPFDLLVDLLQKTYQTLTGYPYTFDITKPPSGIRLLDGVMVIAGIELKPQLEDSLGKDGKIKQIIHIDIDKNNQLMIDGQPFNNQPLQEVFAELNKKAVAPQQEILRELQDASQDQEEESSCATSMSM